MAGGGAAARDCGGLAFAAEKNWAAAAAEFESAARDAQLAHDDRAATYWAQGGNAWLAAGDATKARVALDSALTAGTLTGLQLGEARLDHARALVAADDLASARTDIDLALTTASDDPLAWLLSATLARRMGNRPGRAATSPRRSSAPPTTPRSSSRRATSPRATATRPAPAPPGPKPHASPPTPPPPATPSPRSASSTRPNPDPPKP